MAYEQLIDHLDQSRALSEAAWPVWGGCAVISDRGRWFGATCSASSGHRTLDNYMDVLLVLEALTPAVGIDLILASTLIATRPGVAMVVANAHKRYHQVEEGVRQPRCNRSKSTGLRCWRERQPLVAIEPLP